MKLILVIAWRNIFRHRAKSLVIGSILFLGALLMTVGNGIISGMDKGLEKTIVESFCGDIVIVPDSQESDNVFLSMMGKAIEPLNNFKDIQTVLSKRNEIKDYLPVGKNMAMALNDQEGNPGFVFLMGVNWKNYQRIFPDNFKYLEGRPIDVTEKAVLVTSKARDDFYDFSNIWLTAEGDSIHTANLSKDAKKDQATLVAQSQAVFMGMNDNNSTTDIRLPVRAVVKYRALNHILGHFVIADIESYRDCLGYFGAQDQVKLSEDKQKVLNTDNLDDLFASDELMVENQGGSSSALAAGSLKVEKQAISANTDLDAGTFNMVLVMLKDHNNLDKQTANLNEALKTAGVKSRAITWKKAMGMIGSMAALIKSALFIFVMMLFVVAIIIIVNTLSMAALERTTEIGMMRAVGARKGFISKMFLAETAALSAVFGGAGIVVGVLVVRVLAALNLTSDNDMIQLFFGGDVFCPLLNSSDVILAVVQLALVTLIAVVYPIRVARGITPLDAISRD